MSGGIAPSILNLSIRLRWVVSFTPWSLYPRGKSPRYRLVRGLGGSKSRSGHGSKENKSHYCPYLELHPGSPARSLVTILTELPRILKNYPTDSEMRIYDSYNSNCMNCCESQCS